MIAFIVVTVVLGGVAVPASQPAWLRGDGVVFAPIDPIVRRIAQTIEVDTARGEVLIERGDRKAIVRIATDAVVKPDGSIYVRLAPVVRSLGGSISFDAVRKVVAIEMPASQPVATPTPYNTSIPAVAPTTIFTPQPTTAPRPVVSGSPQPRRTPVPAAPSYPETQ